MYTLKIQADKTSYCYDAFTVARLIRRDFAEEQRPIINIKELTDWIMKGELEKPLYFRGYEIVKHVLLRET